MSKRLLGFNDREKQTIVWAPTVRTAPTFGSGRADALAFSHLSRAVTRCFLCWICHVQKQVAIARQIEVRRRSSGMESVGPFFVLSSLFSCHERRTAPASTCDVVGSSVLDSPLNTSKRYGFSYGFKAVPTDFIRPSRPSCMEKWHERDVEHISHESLQAWRAPEVDDD